MKVGLSNIEYQVFIAKDGDQWCALVGPNLQEGVAGFGKTIHEALYNLADQLRGRTCHCRCCGSSEVSLRGLKVGDNPAMCILYCHTCKAEVIVRDNELNNHLM